MKQAQLFEFLKLNVPASLPAGLEEGVILHMQILKKWNKKFNLIGVESEAEIVEALYYDSLLTCSIIANKYNNIKKLCDIGSGAGFPGLFLALFMPQAEVTLYEAKRKKASFLKESAQAMKLANVTVVQKTVAQNEFKSEFMTSRAAFPPKEWLGLAKSLLVGNGLAALYFGGLRSEAPDDTPGLQRVFDHEYKLPFSGKVRTVLVYKNL
jgi:16S rRNA (guanine527-N7)-methyltransferase